MKNPKKTVLRILSAILAVLTCSSVPTAAVFADDGQTVPLCNSDVGSAVQITDNYGIQFNITLPFDFITVYAPSWSNNIGSLRFELFRWDRNYRATIGGTSLATADFIDYKDNETLKFEFDRMEAGEYLLKITNISENKAEAVGVWTSPGSPANVKNYKDGVEISNAADAKIHCIGSSDSPLDKISGEIADETPVYEEITESVKDLTKYNLPSDSRYLTSEIMSDTWVFTDGLGRKSVTNAEAGDVRENRTLALFYWMWHAYFQRTPFNTQEFIDSQTAAGIPLEDYIYDYNYEKWPSAFGAQYFWNKPIFGYYSSKDVWVLRRQAELLAAAGVDVVFSDNSNATLVFDEENTALYKAWYEAQKDGVNTPKISYLMPFAEGSDTRYQLGWFYNKIYRDGNYRSLWYYLDGKPMVMAYKSSLSDSATDKNISEFFSYREGFASYFSKRVVGKWGWLSVYPQAAHYKRSNSPNIEEMSVGVAQNANYLTGELAAMNGGPIMGRSYTSDRSHLNEEGSSLWGYNFAEQFEYALSKDPKVIFVTGWNEWAASRYESWPDGNTKSAVTNAFPDQFNDEYSRDIEPTRGALGDNYYYQFVNFVRRYKGVRAIPTPSENKSIDITAGEEQWANVEPYYAASIGNIGDRDSDGYVGVHYSDYSGRNDIIGAQLARDGEWLYFHVECASDITSYTDPLWMNLYIDCDDENGGWNSFDYVINKSAASADTVVLERFTGNGYESVKVADCSYCVNGRYMTVRVAKSDLGLSGDDYTVNFSWTDNVHDADDSGSGEGRPVYTVFSGDILDFYTSGDVAPGGRFKFSFVSSSENAKKSESGNTDTDDGTENGKEDKTDENGGKKTGAAGIIIPIAAAAVGVGLVCGVIYARSRRKRGKKSGDSPNPPRV